VGGRSEVLAARKKSENREELLDIVEGLVLESFVDEGESGTHGRLLQDSNFRQKQQTEE
jgi:hypothetical protein